MMRKKHYLINDTETVGLGGNALVFDFAYVIATKTTVKVERSFLIREILTNPRVMLRAIRDNHWRESFGGKMFSHYIPRIAKGELTLHSWRDVCDYLREDMRTYGIDVYSAYNLRFDMGALAKTQEFVNPDAGKILEYAPDLLCLWQFSCETVCQSPLYHEVAQRYGEETGWITPAGNVRTNAEKVYAYLTQQHDFIESHTALEDARIETEILWRLLAQKKRIPYNVLDHMPWRLAQRFFDRRKEERK